jgi:histidinol-phosphatase (PHP family)
MHQVFPVIRGRERLIPMDPIERSNAIPHDYHVHTHFSCDSEASMEAMCQAAIRMGINELGLSDHFDLHPNEPFQDYLDIEAWWKSFEHCQTSFGGELILRAGVEVGESHLFPGRVARLCNDFPWDYILGSLHWVGDTCVFDHAFFHSDERNVYLAYFHELERLVKEGTFDILAHFDVVKRYGFEHYGPFLPEHYEEHIRRILNFLAERGKGLEINSSTMRRSIQHPSPDITVMGWFLEEGGRYVTLGSDAHTPEDVGFGLESIKMMARSEGLGGLASYHQHSPVIVDFAGSAS